MGLSRVWLAANAHASEGAGGVWCGVLAAAGGQVRGGSELREGAERGTGELVGSCSLVHAPLAHRKAERGPILEGVWSFAGRASYPRFHYESTMLRRIAHIYCMWLLKGYQKKSTLPCRASVLRSKHRAGQLGSGTPRPEYLTVFLGLTPPQLNIRVPGGLNKSGTHAP
eukprot:5625068-Pyramimonas_sp.AAC.2